jgi:hypothetical protein
MAASVMAVVAPRPAAAAQTDPRWFGWLGCWQTDSTGGGANANVTCIVPVAGSSVVEALTIARGKITSRRRLDASGRPRAIDGQGCHGMETTNWSRSGRRVYLRSDYTCDGGIKGASTSVLALSTTGEWLRVDEIRSGSGSIVSVDRRRGVGVPAELPAGVARTLERQELAVTAARAATAAPITADEVIDATRAVGGGVVRQWLVAAAQRFELGDAELAALTHADLPPSVLQAVLATQAEGAGASTAVPQRNADVYLNTAPSAGSTAPEPPLMRTMYVCPPVGCSGLSPYSAYNGYSSYPYAPYPSFPIVYSAPLIVRRGFREPFRRPFGSGFHQPGRPRQPVGRPPVGRRPRG